MASISGNGSRGHHKFTLNVTETGTDTSANTSTVSWSLVLSPIQTRWDWNRSGVSYTVDVDGQVASGTIPKYDGSSTVTIASGTKTITHNNDGTKSIGFSFNVKDTNTVNYTPGNASASGTLGLTNIPRKAEVTSGSDFNDEGNPVIKYNNPGGFRINARLEFAGQSIQRDNIPNTGSYTFELTSAEREILRNACTTAKTMTVREVIGTCIGGTTENFWSWQDKTMSIINAEPTFEASNLSYQDTNETTVAITGDASKIVRNNSTLAVTFTGATPKKGASIVSYELKFNGIVDTNTVPFTKSYGIINLSENAKAQVTVTDSRGYTKTIEKTITILDWVNPTATIEIGRINNYEDSTNLKTRTTISSVGNKNAIQSIKYRYKKTSDSTYSAYVSMQDNTTYTLNLNKNYAWNVQVEIKDKFGTTTYNMIVAKGKPILFIDKDKLSVGINCFPVGNGTLELNDQEVLEYDVVDQW